MNAVYTLHICFPLWPGLSGNFLYGLIYASVNLGMLRADYGANVYLQIDAIDSGVMRTNNILLYHGVSSVIIQ
jgi:hypothetical protein